MKENTFYDIHMHALNLSHPYLVAFLQRVNLPGLLLLGPLASIFMRGELNRVENLLAVMENDIGSFFLMMENYLQRSDKGGLIENGRLKIGGKFYSKIVLTPLMMDFGYKKIRGNKHIYYNEPSQKPIVEQVEDVFNGISKYKSTSRSQMFEIYPFLGLNTRNYDLVGKDGKEGIKEILDKYFSAYKRSREELHNNMGKFDGDIKHIGSNYFAGIKLYPPLGFDPWPTGKKEGPELEKVQYLYDYCCKHHIPITIHGSEGGFVVVSKKQMREYCSIRKWRSVLSNYRDLKSNLAHFPIGETYLHIFPNKKRLNQILGLVRDFDNVYVDFSFRAVNDKYYALLRELIDGSQGKVKEKLPSHALFGSDFTVNLLSIESYNKYLRIFSDNRSLGDDEKDSFCSVNPERFLFS